MALGIIGIITSLLLLITLAYRGVPVILAAPLASVVAVVFSGAPILASYTEIFMPAMAAFVGSWFPVFLFGAIFGVLMTVTGYAESIARTVTKLVGSRSAIAATIVTSALMTYGGISLFVVAFVMYPLARELFRVADIPRRLIPATIALGIFTFTMTALPGSPQVQNIIPGQFFGTGSFAAPGIGLLGGALIFGLGLLWLEYRRTALIRKGESFDSAESARSANGSTDAGTGDQQVNTLEPANRLVPFLPLLTVFAVNFACTLLIFPALDWSYLAEEKFGGVAFEQRMGLWAVLLGIIAAILVLVALNFRNFATLWAGSVDGAKRSMFPIFSTASEVGYGAVVASVAAFAVVRDSVFGLGLGALWTSVFSVSITAGLTGSSSGGMTIALNALGEDLRAMAEQEGVATEAMHRLTAMAAGGLDTLPHSGAVVTLLIVCGLTHRQSYKDLGVVTLAIPVLVVIALVSLVSVVGSF
ncbi:GntP family permease [Nocardiopsis metallicus]|uniref:H+/gluconate symporter-like permease n=1 Tax=Nocardiopsis metallicus TaxID=179819 RepID=A0A840W2R4_9ACTN|nr:GntP family permease [Nocardiopsis metallicus]MBB5489583.1 H+/gluconate symporter-like permease [Nocardiopsis metallicus]